ncbi:3-oxoacyl-[acyl-carrier-protein] reductase [Ilyobacter polytropus]|uniref:3-oxoacyl-[acyl-carrier-protein] reductase n=1 Tax=Ilyobacter polytropus (strain ATCC 51220 / DSM 2926 / LMG 16218 / CuHBu1) TaxID=572544 RepID=E3H858_ILYPC|nr:3-oxoacyl-[acyl-carrier-protein] reductase [Ilyobacter polytropus]ADO83289.1 3-oxoacyl-(acyl-carrier-protein) reductase [Ilyobacter polytropus DSM 2926]
MIDLKGKVAVITGSARGIGRAVAEKLAQAGANLVITDILAEIGEKTAKEISEKYGIEAIFVPGNVVSSESMAELASKTLEKFGKIDILVNNAGITRDTLFMRMKEEDFDLVMNINLKGTYNCTQAFFKTMVKQRFGSIINMASVVGLMGNAGQVNYSASKAGMIGMTKSLAKEVGKRGVRVNAVAPGYIQSEMTDVLSEDVKKEFAKNIPMGSMGTPEDIANAVLFLSSDLSSYITGQTLSVNGGMLMP